jgi:hypothetical protein
LRLCLQARSSFPPTRLVFRHLPALSATAARRSVAPCRPPFFPLRITMKPSSARGPGEWPKVKRRWTIRPWYSIRPRAGSSWPQIAAFAPYFGSATLSLYYQSDNRRRIRQLTRPAASGPTERPECHDGDNSPRGRHPDHRRPALHRRQVSSPAWYRRDRDGAVCHPPAERSAVLLRSMSRSTPYVFFSLILETTAGRSKFMLYLPLPCEA